MSVIISVDPSLSNTAIIIGDGTTHQLRTFPSKPAANGSVLSRITRYEHTIIQIMDWLPKEADAIYIEGYSFGSKGSGVVNLGEYGSLLRWHLLELTQFIYEVSPGTLKKFACGKGNAPKNIVAAHLTKRYDVLFESDDEYDAFALYQLGLVAEQLVEPDTEWQREAAAVANGSKARARGKNNGK